MSKFIEAVTAGIDGRRIAPFIPKLTVAREITTDDISRISVMNISVLYRVQVTCVDDAEFDKALYNVKAQLKEEIYGDIRKLILDLELAIMNYDRSEMLEIIQALYKEVGLRG